MSQPEPLSVSTIAVVDDDPSMCRAVERLLRADGYEPRIFSSAEGFLSSANVERHACLILDIHMPEMSGIELYRCLEARSVHLPVVFVTAFDEGDAPEQARRVAGSRFLRKPFSGAALLAAVELILQGKGSDRDAG